MCERVQMPGGGFAIVCGGHRHSKKPCAYSNCRGRVEVLCDGPGANGKKTCDRGTCRAHAKHVGPDRDLCWQCAIDETKGRRQGELPL